MPTNHPTTLEQKDFYPEVKVIYRNPTSMTVCGITLTSESFVADGATVNLEDQDGRTLLHWAALGGHAPICLALIEQGLAVDSKDSLG